jgi:hypothetical protein
MAIPSTIGEGAVMSGGVAARTPPTALQKQRHISYREDDEYASGSFL